MAILPLLKNVYRMYDARQLLFARQGERRERERERERESKKRERER